MITLNKITNRTADPIDLVVDTGVLVLAFRRLEDDSWHRVYDANTSRPCLSRVSNDVAAVLDETAKLMQAPPKIVKSRTPFQGILLDLLCQVEWVHQSCNYAPECPICGHYQSDGHAKDCELKKAIK